MHTRVIALILAALVMAAAVTFVSAAVGVVSAQTGGSGDVIELTSPFGEKMQFVEYQLDNKPNITCAYYNQQFKGCFPSK